MFILQLFRICLILNISEFRGFSLIREDSMLMKSVPIHLILPSDNPPGHEGLKSAFIPLNGAFELKMIRDEDQFQKQLISGIHIAIYAGNNPFISWQECCRRVRLAHEKVLFVLISDDEKMASAISQGADLLVRNEDASDLPIIIGALLKRHRPVKQEASQESTPVEIQESEINELQLKNKELEKINFELDRFVYSASHDLRAPLTSVLGLLYLLREDVSSDGTKNLVNLMVESILKLDNTIRDIVAYSRNNRTEIVIEPLRIKPVVEDVLSGLKYLESDSIHLNHAVSCEDEGVFLCDRNRLQIILNNLISNSIRYRHPAREPQVIISVHRLQKSIDITVADNGIGINDTHLDKIFEMFYRTNDNSSGSGLGLYIVMETVKKLDGSVEVRSKVNEGSLFKISIPIFREITNKTSLS